MKVDPEPIGQLLLSHAYHPATMPDALSQSRVHLVRREHAALAVDGIHYDARQGCRTTALGEDDVARTRADHLVTWAGMHRDRDLVAHGAGGQEKCGLLPSISETRAQSSRVDGSASCRSSPKGTSRAASRMARDGRVWVSE